jgi:hypothetical protein
VFLKPVFQDEQVIASVIVKSKLGKGKLLFDCTLEKENGEIAIKGEAIIKI